MTTPAAAINPRYLHPQRLAAAAAHHARTTAEKMQQTPLGACCPQTPGTHPLLEETPPQAYDLKLIERALFLIECQIESPSPGLPTPETLHPLPTTTEVWQLASQFSARHAQALLTRLEG